MNVIIGFSDDAKAIYDYVSKRSLSCKAEKIMYSAILRNIALIKQNPMYGAPVPKRLIPKEYLSKYHVQNLYRVELPFFWRMLYTLRDNKVEVIAFVLDIVDHKDYNKKFRYK